MKIIDICAVVVTIFLGKLNLFGQMNNYKNIVKCIICAFALGGLTACGGGGGSPSNGGGGSTDPITITANESSLRNFTLQNIDTAFLDEIRQQIDADISIDQITITISNSDASSIGIANRNDWETTTIDVFDLVQDQDGSDDGDGHEDGDQDGDVTITVTYSSNGNAVGTATTITLNIIYDGTAPSITSFTEQSTLLPITDGENFSFTLTFSENINTSTFTAADFVNLSSLITISNITFSGATATITATTDIPENQQGNLTIDVGTEYEDLAGNSPAATETLYDLDVQLPTVSDTDSETTTTDNEYIITYTFSEAIGAIIADNFEINNGTISQFDHTENTVTFTLVSDIDTVTITVTGFTDTSKNVGNVNTATFNLGNINVSQANSIIGDDDLTKSGNNYTFELTFNREIEANTLLVSDLVPTNTNFQVVSITPSSETAATFTVTVNIPENDTAKADFTIAVGGVGVGSQINNEPIVISIDRAPRVVSIPENSQTEFSSDIISSGISYTFTFSEAINGLEGSDFVITPANSGVSIQSTSFNDGITEATVTFTVSAGAADDFLIDLPDGSYTDDGGNQNRETTAELPLNITIDTIAPRVVSINDSSKTEFNKDDLGNSSEFSYTFTFSETINDLSGDDFEIIQVGNPISVPTVSLNDKIATVTFAVAANTEGDFSISLKANSYTDQLGNQNSEEEALPEITIDNMPPTITSPSAGNYPVPTQPFDITIDFSEELNLTDNNNPVLNESDITLTNATSTITIENSGGKGRVKIDLELDLSKTQATITINGSDYSDALGNIGDNYTLTIDTETLVSGWLSSESDCQNFSFDGGDGSAGNPYQISNICQLQNIAANTITAGGVAYTNLLAADKSYILIEDIDATYTAEWDSEAGLGFNPIGNNNSNFNGTFDGKGFTLSNLIIDRTTDYIGLFGYNTGTIKDITLDSVDITGNDHVGGLVGRNDGTNSNVGTIENSNSSGSISGNFSVGGLVGSTIFSSSIENSTSSANVKGTNNNVGGLVGNTIFSSIENSTSSGSVSGIGNVGGFIGFNDSGTITDSTSYGNVEGDENVGGFVGDYKHTTNSPANKIANSTSYGDVVGKGGNNDGNIGGFVGQNQGGTIENSLSSGSVQGNLTVAVGGFVGANISGTYTNDTWCKPAADSSPVAAFGSGGPVTGITNCIIVETADDVQNIKDNLSGYYIVGNDIDLSTIADFTPIGNNNTRFTGTFDGGGFTLSNLAIDRDTANFIGLFGYNEGTINDIILESVNITGAASTGGLVGRNQGGTINNSKVSGSISGTSNVGGIVGFNTGTIENSISSGSVSGTGNIGGFVGTNTSGTYTNDTWCNLNSSTLNETGDDGNITGITTITDLTDAKCQF